MIAASTRGANQIAQPPPFRQLDGGGVKPPAPRGMPLGLTAPAEMSLRTSEALHSGQAGAGSSAENTIRSNRAQHWQHSYS